MAYEDQDTNPFTSPQQGPIQTAQPDAILTSTSVGGGGYAGTWSGFEETSAINTTSSTDPSTTNPFTSSNNTSSATATSGLFAGMTIDSPNNESTEFVSLNSVHTPPDAGSWAELDTKNSSTDPNDLNDDDDDDEETGRVLTNKEQVIAEKMAYMPWGCKKMFVLFDTPIAVHWSFILVLAANFVYSIVYYHEVSFYSIAWSLLVAIFWFIFVLVNQISHVVAAKVWGVETTVSVCWMFGGYRQMIIAETTWQHIRVSASGPISHVPWIVLFGFAATVLAQQEGVSICYCVYIPFQQHFGFNIMNFCLWQNIWLFAWNLLLPCYPLDGALIMACFMLNRGYSPDRVLAIMLRVSGVCFIGCGLWAFFTKHLWAFISTLFLAWNIGNMCWYLGRAESHPLFGLKTADQIATEDIEHGNELVGRAVTGVAMQTLRSQTSSAVNQNNAWS